MNICTYLLRELAKWLMSAECPMHFVAKCNLFDDIQFATACDYCVSMLNSISIEYLSSWFCEYNIRRSTCSHNASAFDSIRSYRDNMVWM